jgi:hypothetical protein
MPAPMKGNAFHVKDVYEEACKGCGSWMIFVKITIILVNDDF